MAKKNYMKYIPKVGSTVAVAVAMTVALSTQVSATELDDKDLQNTGNPPVDGQESNVNLDLNGMEPAEANAAVEEANQEIIADNQETGEENKQVEQDNNATAENNEGITDGALENPNLDLPDAPEIPNTDGMDVEDHNNAVNEYNGKVDEYNDAANQYNDKVDEYNKEVDEFNQQEETRFETEQEEYNKAEGDHIAAENKQQADLAQQEKNDTAYDAYEKEKDDYDQAGSDYQDALDQYEESLLNGTATEESRNQYLQEKEAYDKAHADYLAALEKYNESVTEHDPGSEEYQKYLQDKAAYDQACAEYLAALENYNNVILPQYEKDSAEYQQYLADKAAYDQAYAEYLEKLYQFNNGELADHKVKVEQSELEQEILQDVNEYNEDVSKKNDKINKDNAALENNIDVGVVESLKDVGDINKQVSVDADILTTLGSFATLAKEQADLEAAGKALAEHPGKGADLGSDAYAQYLAAVAAHNEAVDQFNLKVAAYNEAVVKYNEKVDAFNATQKESSSSSTGIGTSSSNKEADWGNIKTQGETVGHIDVKYNAAASKDVTKDDKGNEVYSNSVTGYEVTGVYSSEAAAKSDPGKYGISYQESDTSTTVETQSVSPYGGYEFHAGNVNGIKLDMASGKISFYATLEGENGTENITVNLDANSVYADGSYYAVSNGGFLGDYRFGEKKDQKLEVVTIDGVRYYNISGHSVYVISALTCDGMSKYPSYPGGTSTLDPWGLDLVLNLQTMIKIHQSASAQKIGFMTYELEKYMATDDKSISDPGKTPTAPTFNQDVLDPVEDPGKRPNAPIYDPGTFDMDEPDAAIEAEYLEYAGKLDKLNEKVEIEIPPVNPNPVPQPEPPAPQLLMVDGDGLVTIEDGAVPLADVPKTGDASVAFGAMSAFSGIGLAFLQLFGSKKKEEN